MFNKLLESLYLKIFVNIIVNKSTTTVYIETCDNSGVVESEEEVFKTTSIDEKMYYFISSYTKESPYYYVSILDNSTSQGAIPSCSTERISMHIDKQSSNYKYYENSWTYYTSKYDIKETQNRYEKVGIDFIFSPFVLLHHFFKDKIDTHMAMFILIEDNYLSLSVFHNSELLYGVHLDMDNDTESDELIMDEMDDEEINLDHDDDDGIDLDDIDVLDEMDSLDDFGDIEDLDSIDEIDEFADARDIEEELTGEAEDVDMPMGNSDSFTEDYHRFSMIQSAVNSFYQDENFDSQFVESVYIADGVGVSGDLKTYLEEEMFLSVYVRHMSLSTEVCELAKMEVK